MLLRQLSYAIPTNESARLCRFVNISVQWDNVNGLDEKFSEDDAKLFTRIREAAVEKEVADFPRRVKPEDLSKFLSAGN